MNINNLMSYLSDIVGADILSLVTNKFLQVIILSILVIATAFAVKTGFKFITYKIDNKTKFSVDGQIFSILLNPIFYSILLLGLLMPLEVLGVGSKSILSKIILSCFWLMWGRTSITVSKLTLTFLSKTNTKPKIVRRQTLPLFANLSLVVIILITLYFILETWEVNMTALVASAGVAGLAIGFAAKDTLSNLFSGVFILADQPYKVGDYVVLDTGERGEVTHIGIRSTRLLTRDDVEITVPNAIMGNTKIINESGGPYKKYRIRVKIGVAYGTEISLVRATLTKIALDNVEVCEQPEPKVRLRNFGNSSLDFELLCWVEEPSLRGKVLDSLNENIYKEFIANKIEIPYPKQDVYIKELDRKP